MFTTVHFHNRYNLTIKALLHCKAVKKKKIPIAYGAEHVMYKRLGSLVDSSENLQ